MIKMNSIDGEVVIAPPKEFGCCPDNILSISKSSIVCGFVSLLPNGPLWDADKLLVIQNQKNKPCGSLADYAHFIGTLLYQLIYENLWPALKESNPNTAVTTLDDWLDRLGWVDCYESCNRIRLSNSLSPFEIMGYCGPIYCAPTYSDDFKIAFKSAIVKSLHRLRLGIIPNISSINAVLEPLGVAIKAGEKTDDVCNASFFNLILYPTSKSIIVPQKNGSKKPVYTNAYYDNGCDIDRTAGLPRYAWPTVMAAECIVRSILWSKKLNLETQLCLNPEGV